MEYLYTRFNGGDWHIGEWMPLAKEVLEAWGCKNDLDAFETAVDAIQLTEGFYAVMLPNDMRWDRHCRQWKHIPNWYKECRAFAEPRLADAQQKIRDYWDGFNREYLKGLIHNLNSEPKHKLLFASGKINPAEESQIPRFNVDGILEIIAQLTKDQQTELYHKMHKAWDHCRIYRD
jgi:hypothetical protein